MAQALNGVEIFSTGTFTPGGSAKGKRVTIKQSDLDEMVSSFNDLVPIGGFTPVLKLGHAEAQKFIGQGSGAPNLGIIEKIWIVGSKVLANFSNVPDSVVDLIRGKRFNNVSIEVVPSLKFDGRTFKNVLTAVALLGAELPAVKGLADLSATLFTQAEITPIEADQIVSYEWEKQTMPDVVTYTQAQHDALLEAAVSKAVTAETVKYTAESEKLNAERDEAREALKTKNTEFAAFQAEVSAAQATALVDDAVDKKKILPKQRDAALAFMQHIEGTVKFGDEEKSAQVMFAEFLEAMPPKVDTAEKGAGSPEEKTDYSDDPGAEVDRLSREAMKANDKLLYVDARAQVLASDEALKSAYVNMS